MSEFLYKGKETEYNKNYYYKRRQAIFDYLGGRCVNCGTIENLEVDHIDRKDKNFHIGKKLSVKNNKEELAKCQLLCKSCHLEKTSIENSGYTHGTIYAWMKKKCTCNICSTSKRKWHDNRNSKRRVKPT